MSHITATFESKPQAEAVLAQLENAGLREDQMSLIVAGETRSDLFLLEDPTPADEGLAVGATFGGVAGAILGSVLAAGAIAVPGLNLVIVGGLASGLAGLGAGAAAGGVMGALIGAGMTDRTPRLRDKDVKDGDVLVDVDPDTERQMTDIESILRNSGAQRIVH